MALSGSIGTLKAPPLPSVDDHETIPPEVTSATFQRCNVADQRASLTLPRFPLQLQSKITSAHLLGVGVSNNLDGAKRVDSAAGPSLRG